MSRLAPMVIKRTLIEVKSDMLVASRIEKRIDDICARFAPLYHPTIALRLNSPNRLGRLLPWHMANILNASD
jgi:hypothetical protein